MKKLYFTVSIATALIDITFIFIFFLELTNSTTKNILFLLYLGIIASSITSGVFLLSGIMEKKAKK